MSIIDAFVYAILAMILINLSGVPLLLLLGYLMSRADEKAERGEE